MPKVPRTPPPDRLDALPPDVHVLPAGTTVWRIYFRGGRHPTRWSRFRRVGPTDARFDHQLEPPGEDQGRAVLYAAADPATCFAEVFQRTRLVNRRHNEPWLVGFETAVPAPLLDLTGAFATRAGASMALMTAARSVSRNWARAFYQAYPATVGLYYPSSMHANRPAMVLTDRAEAAGVMPARPRFHRALGDPALLSVLKNVARGLGYALR